MKPGLTSKVGYQGYNKPLFLFLGPLDEKVKIQRCLSGVPSIFSDKIQYDDPKTLEEAIRRDKFLYD
jgi:hypothetical protein